MRLNLFGNVQLVGSRFSRPKPLLLLAYVTLEGSQTRSKLAELFWRDDTDDKKALAKKLAKLSVILAQFKKEGASGVLEVTGSSVTSTVSCDVLHFMTACEAEDFTTAITYYLGSFLAGLDLTKLELSPELEEWVLDKREQYASRAQLALLYLAEAEHAAGKLKPAKDLAERAYRLADAPEPEPSTLNRLNLLLAASEVGKEVQNAMSNSLVELDDTSRRVFLALALQDTTNLTIVRSALKLSLSETDLARETLIMHGLIDPDTRILARDMARDWLATRPTERAPLLLALARNTPAEQAYGLFRSVHERTQGFGGLGDLPRARAAYYHEAKRQMDKLEYAQTAMILAEARAVEALLETEAHSESYFLEAYALERQGQYKDALKLLDTLSTDNPNITALRSVLLWRTGKSEDAHQAAEAALDSGLDWLWARATASNTLGYLAYSEDDLLDAAAYFKKSASLFQAAGEKHRWVGSLTNYATTLDEIVVQAEMSGSPDLPLRIAEVQTAFQVTLDALEEAGGDSLTKARILLNQGMFWEGRRNWSAAEESYQQAGRLLEQQQALDLRSRLSLNLGVVYLHQQRQREARQHFSRAVTDAAQAGEYTIQGMALANLAFLENDSDNMELALELLEQSGALEHYQVFVHDYEQVLAHNLGQALQTGSQRQTERTLKKLVVFYKKQQRSEEASKVEHALAGLKQNTDLSAHEHLLRNLIKPLGSLGPSDSLSA